MEKQQQQLICPTSVGRVYLNFVSRNEHGPYARGTRTPLFDLHDDDGYDGGDGQATTSTAAHRRGSKRARAAAISEAIRGLRQVKDREGEECAVCLKDFRAEETLRAMPCSHAFHSHCISEWLHRNAACPLCRRQLPTTPEEGDEDEEQRRKRRIPWWF